ncbi:MAG: hypothetical protein LBE18_00100 [Planctomycetaceae bacterium]|jgi:hypothetical protein|nr:hypothetical protein [Planctomycetaceae bacterium]
MRTFIEYSNIYGTINVKGKNNVKCKTFAFMHPPHFAPAPYGDEKYYCKVVDSKHVVYDVKWEPREEYDPYCDNEGSIACDWDNPSLIKKAKDQPYKRSYY